MPQDQDDGADRQLLRVEQVDLLGLDEGHTLHADHAEQVDAQSAHDSTAAWY